MNLDRGQNPVRNSWAIVTPPSSVYSQGNRLNAIDRSDNNVPEESDQKYSSQSQMHAKSTSSPLATINQSEMTTEKFDPEKFQPEFQGGFKPIYPPGTTTTTTTAPKTIETKSIDAKSTKPETEDSIESLISDFLSGEDPENTTSN